VAGLLGCPVNELWVGHRPSKKKFEFIATGEQINPIESIICLLIIIKNLNFGQDSFCNSWFTSNLWSFPWKQEKSNKLQFHAYFKIAKLEFLTPNRIYKR